MENRREPTVLASHALMNIRPETCRTIKSAVGSITGISFVILASINFSRWDLLEGWYSWSTASSFLGGLLLLVTNLISVPFRFQKTLINILLIFGALLALDALAFFIVMRIPMDWKDILTFAPPPVFLSLWWTTCFFCRGRQKNAAIIHG